MREVKPKDTTRAYAFDMWMKAPMPMVTFFKTLDVVLNIFTSCTGSCSRNRICRLNDTGDKAGRFNIAMMGFYRIQYNCRLLVLSAKICTQLYMSTFHVMVNRLSNIME